MTDTAPLIAAAAAMQITIDEPFARLVLDLAADITAERKPGTPLVLGVSGAQGSGKSTLSKLLETAFTAIHGFKAVSLSIDDFYLPKAERERLAREVHPLCRTRGVPGTHDAALAIRTLTALKEADEATLTPLPQFSKLEDDRVPEGAWPKYAGQPDIIIFEGWCVGAQHHDPDSWGGPINDLERERDPDGTWWRWSNAHLKDDYRALWDMLDILLFIQVPDFETVVESRIRQEETLVAQNPALAASRMTRAQIVEFTAHYQRITVQLREDLPGACDYMLQRERGYTYHRVK